MSLEHDTAKMLDKLNSYKNDPGLIGELYTLLLANWNSHTELINFSKWCVDNWQCDNIGEAVNQPYTEAFCNSPGCRRCAASKVLKKYED